MSYRISGVLSEEKNELNTVKTRLSYIEVVKTGSGQKSALYNHSPQERADETYKKQQDRKTMIGTMDTGTLYTNQ